MEKPPQDAIVGVGNAPRDDASMVGKKISMDGGLLTDASNSATRASLLPAAEIEVLLPFHETAQVTLVVSAVLGRLDVHFSVDTTSSMGDEIELLQEDLLTSIVPALRERVADVAMGVSRFEDFPISPFGEPGATPTTAARADQPFFLLSAITQDEKAIQRALSTLNMPLGYGGDSPEAGAEALFQIATGAGYRAHGRQYIEAFRSSDSALGSLGGVGFRQRALPLVVHITDSVSHDPSDYGAALPGVHDIEDAIAALKALGARVIGVASGSSARAELKQLATGTGAVLPADSGGTCSTGTNGAQQEAEKGMCPLVFETDAQGNGLSEGIVDSIIALLDGLRFAEVRAVVAADPLGVVDSIGVVSLPQTSGIATPMTADLRPLDSPDGVEDSFVDVFNSAQLGFIVNFRNDVVEPSYTDQSFRVLIQILGDGWVIEEHLLRVVVPKSSAMVEVLDAGGGDARTGPPPADASPDTQL